METSVPSDGKPVWCSELLTKFPPGIRPMLQGILKVWFHIEEGIPTQVKMPTSRIPEYLINKLME